MKKKSKHTLIRPAQKGLIRKRLLSKRNDLSAGEIIEKSSRIWVRLRSLREFKKAKKIMFYKSFGSEVETNYMMEKTMEKGKLVFLPKADTKNIMLSAFQIKSIKNDLDKGAYGILEPKAGRCRKAIPAQIDLVIVPAIAFDKYGHRIGYGKGYYDRYLGNCPREKRIGLAYSFQIINQKIPVLTHDMEVSKIVTENSTIQTRQ